MNTPLLERVREVVVERSLLGLRTDAVVFPHRASIVLQLELHEVYMKHVGCPDEEDGVRDWGTYMGVRVFTSRAAK